jgi:hypothetical protein
VPRITTPAMPRNNKVRAKAVIKVFILKGIKARRIPAVFHLTVKSDIVNRAKSSYIFL